MNDLTAKQARVSDAVAELNAAVIALGVVSNPVKLHGWGVAPGSFSYLRPQGELRVEFAPLASTNDVG